MHFGAGGSGNPKNDNYPGLDADHAPAFWQSVANTFKGNPSVIFNLINEPHDSGSIPWSCYLNGGCTVTGGTGSWTVVGTQSVVNTIRATGTTNPIIIAGLNFSNDLTQWLQWKPTDSANAIIAGAHKLFRQPRLPGPDLLEQCVAKHPEQRPSASRRRVWSVKNEMRP